MAEKQGITLTFEADVEKAEKSVGSLNTKLADLRKDFKDLNKQMKIDPSNFDNVKKALLNLEKQQEAVNEKISIYKNRMIELNRDGKVNSDEWKRLEKAIADAQDDAEWLNNKIEELRKKDLNKINTQFKTMGDNLKKTGEKIENVGNKLKGLSTVAGGALAGSAYSAIQFEDAFSGVEKTVDATDEQIAKLKDGIRDLALEIPATTTEISAVAESAGQLGVATDDILNFSEVMIGLGTATNLTSDEASAMIAQFGNITGLDGEYEQLASTLVALGNNGASTEKDIMLLAQRLAGAGATAGLSNQEILALSSAMANVGINAEAGGSSMSTFISNLEMTVAQGGEALNEFAQVAGVSADEFADTWKTEPAKAIDMFVGGLKEIDNNGGSAILALENLGISEIRQRDMLLRLSNAQGEITKNIDLANSAWESNTALTDETSKKYDNLKSQMEIMRNAIQEVSIKIGESMAPVLERVVEGVKNFAMYIGNLSPSTIQFITVLTGLVAVLAPLLLAVGKIVSMFGSLSTILGTQASAGLLTTLSGLALPITLITGAFALCFQQSEIFRNSLMELWNAIMNSLQPIFESFKEAINRVWDAIKTNLIPIFQRVGDLIGTYLVPIVTTLWNWFSAFLLPIITAISDFMGSFFSASIEVVSTLLNILIDVVELLFSWLKKLFEKLEELGVWEAFEKVLEDIGNVVSDVVGWFQQLFDWVGKCAEKVSDFFGKWGDKLGSIGQAVGNWVGGLFGSDGFGFESGGFTNNITLKTNINVTTSQRITADDTAEWAKNMADVINEELGDLVW